VDRFLATPLRQEMAIGNSNSMTMLLLPGFSIKHPKTVIYFLSFCRPPGVSSPMMMIDNHRMHTRTRPDLETRTEREFGATECCSVFQFSCYPLFLMVYRATSSLISPPRPAHSAMCPACSRVTCTSWRRNCLGPAVNVARLTILLHATTKRKHG
jgi:hypothetical protein